jgi:hypothetical protein
VERRWIESDGARASRKPFYGIAQKCTNMHNSDENEFAHRPGHSLKSTFLSFIFKYIAHFEELLFDNLMGIVKSRKSASHRERPDGKLPAPAIIVNFGVTAHCGPHG